MESGTKIGTTVAGYRVDSLLGRGGMSVVYLAEQLRLGRNVALKLLTPALAADAAFRQRFEHEARRAAEIDHPNVISVYDAGEADGQLYIAMRYVEGGDLGSLLRSGGPLALPRALFILEQTAGGLDAAHARQLVHRDVKPANILIEEGSERAFVTDFGIVKRTAATGLTRTGFFLGTVDYASPEQIEGRAVDHRTDVYALGCVLYECLTGEPPFTRDTEVAVIYAHLSEPPPTVTSARPDLPAALDAVVGRALAKAPEHRYGSCGELIAAARAAAGYGEATTPSQPVRSRPRRRRVILLGAAAVTAAAVAFTVARDDPSAPGEAAREPRTGLAAVIPDELWPDCSIQPKARAGALSTALCAASPSSSRKAPAHWEASLYPDGEALEETFRALYEPRGITPNEGSCTPLVWTGEGTWKHRSGRPGGMRMCYVEGEQAHLVWTHEAALQADHGNVLGIARVPRESQPELYEWWRTWQDEIGTRR